MIGRLRGTLIEKQPPLLVVDVNGVGYEVEAPMSTFYELPAVGEEVVLRTHLSVREDAHVLFGFHSERERTVFRSLIRVSGIGPKLALGLLSGMRAEDFVRCVELKDTATLTKLPGVGKKTAERLIMEMQDRITELGRPALSTVGEPAGAAAPAAEDDPAAEAVSALVALGYKPHEASRLLDGVETEGRPSEELIRAALQKAVRRG
ncbi:MAG: Holliday junction branch migration protein RuvA [Ectothiorhodospiraceae bacterium]|jgi:Holliday junction DNA helicase RuvA